jgi:putative nucleotidyltransferase with HDIG domain
MDAELALNKLLNALERHDPATAAHSREVASISAGIARRMGCDPAEVRFVARAALLHDIGKLHTPLEILLKPGPLDADERVVMDLHAAMGADLVESIPSLRSLAGIVRASQEHFDGSGYPDGLAGDAIPLAARIISVADAYHAMRSDRPYRKAVPRAAAVTELHTHSGTQFDAVVVGCLLESLGTASVAPSGRGAPSPSDERAPERGARQWRQWSRRPSGVVAPAGLCAVTRPR